MAIGIPGIGSRDQTSNRLGMVKLGTNRPMGVANHVMASIDILRILPQGLKIVCH